MAETTESLAAHDKRTIIKLNVLYYAQIFDFETIMKVVNDRCHIIKETSWDLSPKPS